MSRWRRHLAAAAIATAVTTLAGGLSYRVSERYHREVAYHFDSASYRWAALSAFRQVERDGVGAAWIQALRRKDGFDVWVRLLAAPRTLAERYGHLYVALPIFWAFQYLLVGYVLARTGSCVMAFASAALVLTAPLLYLPHGGLADALPESQAAWLLGAAAVCWLRSERLQHLGWAGACGTCLGLLAAQRTVAAAFAAVLFLAPLGLALLRLPSNRRRVRALLATALPAVALAVPVAAIQGSSLYRYYALAGYDYADPATVFAWLAAFVGKVSLPTVVLASALAAGTSLAALRRDREPAAIATAAWFVLCLPPLVAGLRARYFGFVHLSLALLVVLAATLLPRQAGSARRAFALLWIPVLTATVVMAHETALRTPPPPTGRALRRLFDRVLDVLPPEPHPIRVQFANDEVELLFLNQAVFDRGRGHAEHGPALLSVHDSYYRAVVADGTPELFAARAIGQLESARDLWVVVYCDPREIERTPSFDGGGGTELARPVMRLVNEHLVRTWTPVAHFHSPRLRCLRLLRHEGAAQR